LLFTLIPRIQINSVDERVSARPPRVVRATHKTRRTHKTAAAPARVLHRGEATRVNAPDCSPRRRLEKCTYNTVMHSYRVKKMFIRKRRAFDTDWYRVKSALRLRGVFCHFYRRHFVAFRSTLSARYISMHRVTPPRRTSDAPSRFSSWRSGTKCSRNGAAKMTENASSSDPEGKSDKIANRIADWYVGCIVETFEHYLAWTSFGGFPQVFVVTVELYVQIK